MAAGGSGRAAVPPRPRSGSCHSQAPQAARWKAPAFASGKPPAGSAVAVASERRGSSLRKVPPPAANLETGKSTPRASAHAVLSSMLPRGPDAAPRHPPRARNSVAEYLPSAPKEPAPPKRPPLRSASPRVRAMAARVESPRVRYAPADQGETCLSLYRVESPTDTSSHAVRHLGIQDKSVDMPQRKDTQIEMEVQAKSVESQRVRTVAADSCPMKLSPGNSEKAVGTIRTVARHDVQDIQTKDGVLLLRSDSPAGVQTNVQSLESVRAVPADNRKADVVLGDIKKALGAIGTVVRQNRLQEPQIEGPLQPLSQKSESPLRIQETGSLQQTRVQTPTASSCATDWAQMGRSSATDSQAVSQTEVQEMQGNGSFSAGVQALPEGMESPRVRSVPAETDLSPGSVQEAMATRRKVEGLSPFPHRDHRPVATPRNSARSCQGVFGSVPHTSRGTYVAELWLRLARIALLEFTKLPPPHRLVSLHAASGRRSDQGCNDPDLAGGNRWMSMAFPSHEYTDHDCDSVVQVAPSSDAPDVPVCTTSTERAMQAWSRILFRVLGVTTAGADSCAGPGPPVEPERTIFCNGLDLSQGHANICLGDMMEESVTWIEVDFEDDQTSPKQSDQMHMAQEESDDFRGAIQPDFMPTALKDIYRQQNAPGIAAGIKKCLSF